MKKIALVLLIIMSMSAAVSAVDLQNYNLGADDASYWLKSEESPLRLYRDITFTRFSGVDTLLEVSLAKGDAVRLVYDSTVRFGDLNIVVLDASGKVFAKLPSGTMDSLRIVCDKAGMYRIKIVGDGVWWGRVRLRIE